MSRERIRSTEARAWPSAGRKWSRVGRRAACSPRAHFARGSDDGLWTRLLRDKKRRSENFRRGLLSLVAQSTGLDIAQP